MGGLFSRIKVWGATDTLTATDLNNEFNNIINNFIPQEMGSYEATAAQMQIQTSPGALGSESLATSLAGELERIRYVMTQITGNPYWYQQPATSLAVLSGLFSVASANNGIVSGVTEASSSQPTFLVAAGNALSVTLQATATAFSYKIAGVTYSISTNTTLTGLTPAPSSNNTATVADPLLTGNTASQLVGENGTSIAISAAGSNVTALVGKYAAFKTAAGEYMFALVSSASALTNVSRGYFFNSSSALVSRGVLSNNGTLTLMRLSWIYATTARTLTVSYTNPVYAGTAPLAPATGDYWYDTSVNLWKSYSGTAWVLANATLIGTAISDTTNTVGTRPQDFFNSYSALDTVEVQTVANGTTATSVWENSQLSVYGTVLNLGTFTWDAAVNMDTGALGTQLYYYFYITQAGNPIISLVAPFDRRSDLQGWYHPAHAWRCVGQAFTSGPIAPVWDTAGADSFYRQNPTKPIWYSAAAGNPAPANTPTPAQPYGPQQTVELWQLDAGASAFNQTLPPPQTWKGRRLMFERMDTSTSGILNNPILIKSYGTTVLSTTFTATIGATTFVPVSTLGLATGTQVYLLSGPVFYSGTTCTLGSNGTVTTSQAVSVISTGLIPSVSFSIVPGLPSTVVTARTVGIGGYFSAGLNTQGEILELYSDGTAAQIVNRYVPSVWINTVLTPGAFTTAPTLGGTVSAQFAYRRVGGNLEFRINCASTTAGTAGSGFYYWPLASGFTINTFCAAMVTSGTALTAGQYSVLGPAAAGQSTLAFSGQCLGVNNAGTYAIMMGYQNGTTFNGVGSATLPASNTAGVSFYGCGSVPILGWADGAG